jgi:sulfhydrogenase subunit beta (sulfur reductase)
MNQILSPVIVECENFAQILDELQRRGYELIGPTVQDEAIVYDRITSVQDLPIGWTDVQEAGSYRLQRRQDESWFGYAVGPHSWKKLFFPSSLKLWEAQRQGQEIQLQAMPPEPKLQALIGVRSCELHAIELQDRVFMEGNYVDPHYQTTRQHSFILSVNCAQAGGTCFCVSMQTGPKVSQGFDLAVTEVCQPDRHFFVVEVGSEIGAAVMAVVQSTEASIEAQNQADEIIAATAQQMGRSLDTEGIKELLHNNLEHARWDDVASRCLTCANCTMVCPTCFCSTVEDTTDLTGDHTERWRHWDSCFTTDFSYIHGGVVRSSSKSRYRQWLTHKLASWIDQFGTSGCVGCGRCITWCPVGIDITAEVKAIRGVED